VTSEDDFQRTLDANPGDWQTRLILADWLQERGDPRADGYRALGALRVCPCHRGSPVFSDADREEMRSMDAAGGISTESVFWWCDQSNGKLAPHCLPDDWYVLWRDLNHDTRRDAENAAAFAFTRLLPARRAELLAAMTTSNGR
jgi:uncharacterized protein (TIGR02996 family)